MCNDYDMDILLDYIWDELQKQDDKTGFLNHSRLASLELVYRAMKELFKDDEDVSVCRVVHKPMKCMGGVYVTGGKVVFKNPRVLQAAAGRTNAMTITPRTDGTVMIEFGFNNLVTSVE